MKVTSGRDNRSFRPPKPRASMVRPRDPPSPTSIGAMARRRHIASAPSIAWGPRRHVRCGQPTPPAPLEAHQRGDQDVLRDGDGSRRWTWSTSRFRPRSAPLSTFVIDREMRKRQSKSQRSIICCNICARRSSYSEPHSRVADPYCSAPGGFRCLPVRSGGHGAAASAIITDRWLIVNTHLMRTTLKEGSAEGDLGGSTP